MRYREIGVVATDLNGYGDYLEEAFAKYRIPVFMDYKRSILLNSFVEYVRSILNMAEQSFTYESVFRFLRVMDRLQMTRWMSWRTTVWHLVSVGIKTGSSDGCAEAQM